MAACALASRPLQATVHSLATKFLNEPMHARHSEGSGHGRLHLAVSQVGIGSVDEGMVANTAIRQLVEAKPGSRHSRLCLFCLSRGDQQREGRGRSAEILVM